MRNTRSTAPSNSAAPRVSFTRRSLTERSSCFSDQRDDLGLEALRDVLHLAIDRRKVREVGEARDLLGLVEVPLQRRRRLGFRIRRAGTDAGRVVLVVLGAQAEVGELLGES